MVGMRKKRCKCHGAWGLCRWMWWTLEPDSWVVFLKGIVHSENCTRAAADHLVCHLEHQSKKWLHFLNWFFETAPSVLLQLAFTSSSETQEVRVSCCFTTSYETCAVSNIFLSSSHLFLPWHIPAKKRTQKISRQQGKLWRTLLREWDSLRGRCWQSRRFFNSLSAVWFVANAFVDRALRCWKQMMNSLEILSSPSAFHRGQLYSTILKLQKPRAKCGLYELCYLHTIYLRRVLVSTLLLTSDSSEKNCSLSRTLLIR